MTHNRELEIKALENERWATAVNRVLLGETAIRDEIAAQGLELADDAALAGRERVMALRTEAEEASAWDREAVAAAGGDITELATAEALVEAYGRRIAHGALRSALGRVRTESRRDTHLQNLAARQGLIGAGQLSVNMSGMGALEARDRRGI